MPDNSVFHLPSSPIAMVGTITLLVAFVVAAYSAATGLIGNAQHRRKLVTSSIHALYGLAALAVLASALMIYAFVTHDYTIKYVAATSDTSMSIWYKITSYWGALEGSLMFWVAVLAVFSAVAVRMNSERHRDMIGYVVATIMIVELFFLAILIYNKNPFATFLTEPPVDGKGLNPLLQTYWMVIHPPSLYTGFVAATIPFAFGIAALASGRLDDRWLSSVRAWSLICFFFLSFGLILGGRWAYEELGWGGYWAWDPVENAGLIPWFTMTAFLHSIMIQEQRGMMKVWNLVLVILTFWLTIFGTFMTRSGVVQSVHAFGEDNTLAMFFILFMAFVFVVSFGLLVFRLPRLRSHNTFESFISREYAFLLNNWILLGCAVFVLFVTMFPTLSEAVNGQRITIGPEFFNKWMIPLGLVLLFMAGAAPLLAWRRSTRTRLWSQFAFPTAMMVVTVVVVYLVWPRTSKPVAFAVPIIPRLHLTEHFPWLNHFSVTRRMFGPEAPPVALLNFGLIGFTLASIGQEFYRGARVRMKQVGASALTAVLGLMVSKRRKYGGYIVHVGIAVLFIGFAGQAFETTADRTVTPQAREFHVQQQPFAAPYDATPATFEFLDFQFTYQRFDVDQRDGYTEYRATVTVKGPDGEDLGALYPAKREYDKSDQPTTEVDMMSSIERDIYIVLTGFERQGEQVTSVNLRVYVKPLINWVWIGFMILALGTGICLLPKKWVEAGRRPGAAAAAVLLLALAIPGVAAAQDPGAAGGQGPAQYGMNHNVGASDAHLYRENDPGLLSPYRGKAVATVQAAHPDWQPGSKQFEAAVDDELAPIVSFTRKLMQESFCMCGGCNRENTFECRCGQAAEQRKQLLAMLSSYDLTTPAGRDRAAADVKAALVQQFGTSVLPSRSSMQWGVPVVAVGGALILLFAMGRRWVSSGRAREMNAGSTVADNLEDEDYADRLDDELRETD